VKAVATVWIGARSACASSTLVMIRPTTVEGGILLALGSSIPISPYVTTISFTIYIACRLVGARRTRQWGIGRTVPEPG
jgi:zinc/manganese transport system permease protein